MLRAGALVAIAVASMGVDRCGCRTLFFGEGSVPLNRNEAEAFLKKPGAKFHTYRVNGHTEVGIETRAARGEGASASSITRYLQGTGRFHVTAPTAPAKRRLAKFLDGRFVGLGRGALDSIVLPTAAEFSGQAKLIFSAKGAGAACISFQGKTVASLQKAKGSFKVIGGTGAAKRLHAAGKFRAVLRFPHKQGAQATFEGNPTLGSKRPMPKNCGRLPPVNPGGGGKKVTADFLGFAVSKGAPSSSASLTPEKDSITSCAAGADLWGVVRYSGPKAAKFVTETGLKGAAGEKHSYPVKSGRNALRLLDLPFDNGGDPTTVAQISVKPTASIKLSGDTYLSPYLFLQC